MDSDDQQAITDAQSDLENAREEADRINASDTPIEGAVDAANQAVENAEDDLNEALDNAKQGN